MGLIENEQLVEEKIIAIEGKEAIEGRKTIEFNNEFYENHRQSLLPIFNE